MEVLLGLVLAVLSFVVPWPRRKASRFGMIPLLASASQAGVRFAVAIGGLYFAEGTSAQRAFVRGAIAGGLFAVLMTVLLGGVLTFTYIFRRSWWEFGRAMTEAGFSAPRRRNPFLEIRESRALSRVATALFKEWEAQPKPRHLSPQQFIEWRREAIREQLVVH